MTGIDIIDRVILSDGRGWFLKAIHGKEKDLPNYTGEVYIVGGNEGQSRGGHYHKLAKEWFTLLKGKAMLRLVNIDTGENSELLLDSKYPKTIVVSPLIAHLFENVGDEEFVLLAYTDKLYDPEDTIMFDFDKKIKEY